MRATTTTQHHPTTPIMDNSNNKQFERNDCDSPPSQDIWSTERRLSEKPVPGAPRKSIRRSSTSNLFCSSSSSSAFNTNNNDCPGDNRRILLVNRLLLPSPTIDEDDDDDNSFTLDFRPTSNNHLVLDEDDSQHDPTTVLLLPQSLPWHTSQSDDDDDDEMEDVSLSPRLFGFGNGDDFTRFEATTSAAAVMLDYEGMLEEEDNIFRERTYYEPVQRRLSWTSTTRGGGPLDDERM